MKYNAEFIRAVQLVQEYESKEAAERLFNVLFSAPTPAQDSLHRPFF